MVRNYKRKSDKGSYPRERLQEAVRAVKSGELSGYKAAKIYAIPRMTIMDHVNQRRTKSNTLGRNTALSEEDEKKLASYLHIMERYGFGLSREEVLKVVADYVKTNKIPTPFKDGVPGNDWLAAFKKRHNLSVKKPQPVEFARKKAVDPYLVYPYYDLLEKTIKELGLENKPSAIWNVDETSFSKDPLKTKIVGLKGHASTRTIATPGKENTTVLLGASASGEKIPPLIIFKGKNVWDEWTSPHSYPNTTYAASKNGWMESDIFEAFFKKSFIPAVGTQRPILLIYDGHSTHINLNIMEEAVKQNITILKLPAHTSHILQPLDIAVMKSFKDRWDPLLVKWQRLNIGVPLPKKEFSRLIGLVWAQIDPQVLRNGFKKAGIFPLSRTEIHEREFDAVKLKNWNDFKFSSTTTANEINVKTVMPSTSQQNKFDLEDIVLPPNPQSLLSISLNVIIKTMNVHDYNKYNIYDDHTRKQADEEQKITFEEILLEKVKRGENFPKSRRRKIASGAEVITHMDVIQRKKEELATRNIKKENIHKKTAEKRPVMSIKKTTTDIKYLGNLSKEDNQSLPFVAKQVDDLPLCLQQKKINILSNVVIKKARKSSTSTSTMLDKPGPSGVKRKNIFKEKRIIEKSSGKENKSRRYKSPAFSSSTSVSGSISSHSDSDIMDAVSDHETDYENNDIILTNKPKRGSYVKTNSIKIENLPSNKNKRVDDDCIDKAKEIKDNREYKELQNNFKMNPDGRRNELESINIIESNLEEINNTEKEIYQIGDTVLVRYFIRNSWRYYVGVIENISYVDRLYTISFYKTIGVKGKLKFRKPLRLDKDTVPETLVVKRINMLQLSEKPEEYVLFCNEDLVYFK